MYFELMYMNIENNNTSINKHAQLYCFHTNANIHEFSTRISSKANNYKRPIQHKQRQIRTSQYPSAQDAIKTVNIARTHPIEASLNIGLKPLLYGTHSRGGARSFSVRPITPFTARRKGEKAIKKAPTGRPPLCGAAHNGLTTVSPRELIEIKKGS